MSVIVATAYMDEARRFDWLIALDDGRVLAQDTPAGLQARRAASLEEAFIALLPEESAAATSRCASCRWRWTTRPRSPSRRAT